MSRVRGAILALLCLGMLASAAAVSAQGWIRGSREGRYNRPLREGLPEVRDGFTFVRLQYTSVRNSGSGSGWSTDYPAGEQNLLTRLPQISSIHPSRWADGESGHAVLRATDPRLFESPFLFASDVGTLAFTGSEAAALREYLLKGGFLWVDDFWGEVDWARWYGEITRVLPDHQVVDIPLDHPLLSFQIENPAVPQIPSIQHWRRTGGMTWEPGGEHRLLGDDEVRARSTAGA